MRLSFSYSIVNEYQCRQFLTFFLYSFCSPSSRSRMKTLNFLVLLVGTFLCLSASGCFRSAEAKVTIDGRSYKHGQLFSCDSYSIFPTDVFAFAVPFTEMFDYRFGDVLFVDEEDDKGETTDIAYEGVEYYRLGLCCLQRNETSIPKLYDDSSCTTRNGEQNGQGQDQTSTATIQESPFETGCSEQQIQSHVDWIYKPEACRYYNYLEKLKLYMNNLKHYIYSDISQYRMDHDDDNKSMCDSGTNKQSDKDNKCNQNMASKTHNGSNGYWGRFHKNATLPDMIVALTIMTDEPFTLFPNKSYFIDYDY